MKIRYILLGLPLMSACSDIEPVTTPETVGTTAVVISNTFGDTKASVSANAYTETVPSESAKLMADIWYSTTENTFLGTTQGTAGVSTDGLTIDAHRTITYQGPSITNSDINTGQTAIKYPTGKTLYCVGLYPQGKWSAKTGGTTAEATVDGIQDLMYAPQISGTQADPLSAKAQQFAHQLCWIKIRLRSQDLTAGETWGKVNTVQIKTTPTATVNFDSGNVSFSGTETYLTALDSTAAGGMKMPIMSTEVGSVMVSPIISSPTNGYTLKVVCQHHEKEVTVPLTDNNGTAFTGNTAGKVFVITLYFSPLATIEFTASLSNWEDEARSLTLN